MTSEQKLLAVVEESLEDYLKEDCLIASTKVIENIKEAIKQDSALLEYFTSEEKQEEIKEPLNFKF